MPDSLNQNLLDVLLESWKRNNTILVGLLRALPEGALALKPREDGPTIAELFTHLHFVRLVFISEDAPECARDLPEEEWIDERDPVRIADMLNESSDALARAVRSRIESSRQMDLHYDHPVFMLQHMIWHEGYHHGQIKLALKLAGRALPDTIAGPVTWQVWMDKSPNP